MSDREKTVKKKRFKKFIGYALVNDQTKTLAAVRLYKETLPNYSYMDYRIAEIEIKVKRVLK